MGTRKIIPIVSLYLLAIALGLAGGFAIIFAKPQRSSETKGESASVPAEAIPVGSEPIQIVIPSQSDPVSITRWAYYVPVEQIPGWIDRLAKRENQAALKILFRRWSEVDPAAAMAAALALPPMPADQHYSFDEHGWACATDVPPIADILLAISRTWMKTDPDAAMAALLALPEDFEERGSVLEQSIRDYSESRPADSVRIAFEELKLRGRIAFEQLGESGDAYIVSQLFSSWGKSDPRAAMSRAMELDDPSFRDSALGGSFGGWIANDPEAAQAWFRSLDEADQSDPLWGPMLISLAETNPLQAMELHESEELGIGGGLHMIANLWAETDLEGMIRSAAITDDPNVRSFIAAYGFQLMAKKRSGPEMAALAMELPSDVQQSALRMIAWHWGEQDAATAEAWGLALEDTVLRRDFLREFYNGQLNRAPAEAAASVSRIPDTMLRQIIAASAADAWSRSDLSSAAAWALSSPEGVTTETLAQLQEKLGNTWAWRSPAAALDWYSTLTDEAARDAAGDGIAYVLARKQAEENLDSAAVIAATSGLTEKDQAQVLERISEQAKKYGIGRSPDPNRGAVEDLSEPGR